MGNYADYDGRSAAHLAASRGRVKVLKFLARNGADMWAKDRWQVTPLQEAERTGNPKAAALINSILSDSDSINAGDNESVMSMSLQREASSRLQSVQRTCGK